MPNAPHSRPRSAVRFALSAVTTLAVSRLRYTWFLLFVITLGIISAIVIITTIPLFSDVMNTAGLRNTLRAAPYNDEIAIDAISDGISTPIVQALYYQFNPLLHQYLGNAILPEQSYITTEDFSSSSQPHTTLTTYGTSIQQSAPHLSLIQGRLAGKTDNPGKSIEVMMTPDTAKHFGVSVGSALPLTFTYVVSIPMPDGAQPQFQQHSVIIPAHLVGIFAIPSANFAYWHGEDFTTSAQVITGFPNQYQSKMLLSEDALMSVIDHTLAPYASDALFSDSKYNAYRLVWYYRFDTSHLTINDLARLVNQTDALSSTIGSLFTDLQSASTYEPAVDPYLSSVDISGPTLPTNSTPSSLEEFSSRIAVSQVPIGVFTLLIIALILFFVSLMTTLLIDRQNDTIAILRSRGASRGQIFGTLFLQIAGLGGIAFLIGVPLAAGIVLFLTPHILPTTSLDAINVVAANPLHAMLSTLWYGLTILFVTILTMSISLFFAARVDVLALRRESARTSKYPLWQRLNLDVIAGVVALVGYALSLYVTSVSGVLQGDAKVLIAAPLSIIAPFFLIIGFMFLFLRLFPYVLQLSVRFATHGRGATSLLAFAQVARSPRQSLRMTMLLALATAFAFFTLLYTATEAQHIQDIVTYQTGTDFSATVTSYSSSLTNVIAQYKSIPGVLSTSAGYVVRGEAGTAGLPIDVRAVEPASFGRTVIWSSPAASAEANVLLKQLIAYRQMAIPTKVVPAIVDLTTLNKLLLRVGDHFNITVNNSTVPDIQCNIIGVVDHIPTVNDRIAPENPELGGVIIDYQTYASIYAQELADGSINSSGTNTPVVNQVWLRTKDDKPIVASVRTELQRSSYHISSIVDRRAVLASLQSDPLYLVLTSVLSIGTVTALLLALLGDLLASWTTARTRLVSFATLRALGTTSRQVASMLAWEQAIVYVTGFLLGCLFGIVLAVSVIPALIFTDLNTNLSNSQLFSLQSAIAAHIVLPPSLPLVMLIFIALYCVALTLMVRVVSRPALNQMLRLNED